LNLGVLVFQDPPGAPLRNGLMVTMISSPGLSVPLVHPSLAMPRTEQRTGEELLPDPLVAKRYHVSTRTLPRWDENPALGFPPPIRINNRKYRRLRDLERWERERAAPEPNRGLQNRLKPAQERSDSSHKAGNQNKK
jgi:hypothetical protein